MAEMADVGMNLAQSQPKRVKIHMITNSGNAAPPKKILVVDDNEVIVKTISLKMKSAGYEVVTALDGTEAVAAVRKHRPDLIVLDISFPPDIGGVPWDGFRIIEWLRRVDESTKIPIIVITGGAGSQDKERALAMGAVGFLQKPLDHDELLKLIRATLGAPTATAKT